MKLFNTLFALFITTSAMANSFEDKTDHFCKKDFAEAHIKSMKKADFLSKWAVLPGILTFGVGAVVMLTSHSNVLTHDERAMILDDSLKIAELTEEEIHEVYVEEHMSQILAARELRLNKINVKRIAQGIPSMTEAEFNTYEPIALDTAILPKYNAMQALTTVINSTVKTPVSYQQVKAYLMANKNSATFCPDGKIMKMNKRYLRTLAAEIAK